MKLKQKYLENKKKILRLLILSSMLLGIILILFNQTYIGMIIGLVIPLFLIFFGEELINLLKKRM